MDPEESFSTQTEFKASSPSPGAPLLTLLDLPPPSTPTEEEAEERYLVTLTSYSLDRLAKEPDILRASSARVRAESETLAVKNYRAFVRTADNVQHVREGVMRIGEGLEVLVGDLGRLGSACEEFGSKADTFLCARRRNKMVLQCLTQLLELLEIPQLMETCMRNHYYDEALDLVEYSHVLQRKHPDVQVLQGVVEEVQRSSRQMRTMLLHTLRTSVQLPTCLQVIGHLRRMKAFSEAELRMHFLQCRNAWLQGVVHEIPTPNPYSFLSKLTDIYRVHLFDIVTQYRAIFTNDTTETSRSTGDGVILFDWIVERVHAYLEIVSQTLPLVNDGSFLANLLEQCMYCAMSLGRVGVDFRGLLAPIFEENVMRLFHSNVQTATDRFAVSLSNHKWVATPSALLSSRTSATEDRGSLSPALSLLDHPPLAVLTNAYLVMLNELRQCAPLSLCRRITTEFEQSLRGIIKQLEEIRRESIFTEAENDFYQVMCKATAEEWVPYIIRCFNAVFHARTSLIDVAAFQEDVYALFEDQGTREARHKEWARARMRPASKRRSELSELAASRGTGNEKKESPQLVAEEKDVP